MRFRVLLVALPVAPAVLAGWIAWRSARVGLPMLWRMGAWAVGLYVARSRSGKHSRYYASAARRQSRQRRVQRAVALVRAWGA